jgi:hypothetical protein
VRHEGSWIALEQSDRLPLPRGGPGGSRPRPSHRTSRLTVRASCVPAALPTALRLSKLLGESGESLHCLQTLTMKKAPVSGAFS